VHAAWSAGCGSPQLSAFCHAPAAIGSRREGRTRLCRCHVAQPPHAFAPCSRATGALRPRLRPAQLACAARLTAAGLRAGAAAPPPPEAPLPMAALASANLRALRCAAAAPFTADAGRAHGAPASRCAASLRPAPMSVAVALTIGAAQGTAAARAARCCSAARAAAGDRVTRHAAVCWGIRRVRGRPGGADGDGNGRAGGRLARPAAQRVGCVRCRCAAAGLRRGVASGETAACAVTTIYPKPVAFLRHAPFRACAAAQRLRCAPMMSRHSPQRLRRCGASRVAPLATQRPRR
jgi:hypothetical protein